mgnify:CR=1 FL=1
MSFKCLTFIFFFSIVNALNAQVTLELGAEKDNSIFSENLSKSNGAGPSIFVGRIARGATFRRGLVKFDLSSLPANAEIETIELNLSVFMSARNTITKHRFDIHRLINDWGEANSSGSGGGAAAQTNDATWGSNFYNNSNWTNLGGDFEASISASDSVFFSQAGHTASWSSIGMIADLNYWRKNPSSNFGWVLIGDESLDSSAKAFFSKEAASFYEPFKPKLKITYSLPSDRTIVLNEVNPNKKWIEMYNADSVSKDISSYTLVNGADTSTISGGNISVLNGSLMLDSAAYVVLKWPNIDESVGELALFNADTSSGDLIDYVQYGSGNQSLANKAVTAGVWDSAATFKASISDSTKSYSLTTGQSFSNGAASNSTHWLTQSETPTYVNNPCLSYLVLQGSLVEADYFASDSIQLSGILSPSKNILIDAGKAVHLNPGLLIESGNVFGVKIGGCPE